MPKDYQDLDFLKKITDAKTLELDNLGVLKDYSILETLTIADSKTKYLIIHGKLDDVVSYQQALQTHQFLESKNINNKIVLDDNCHHSISPLAIDEINLLYQDWL